MIRIVAAALLMLFGAAAAAEEWSIVAIADDWPEALEKFPDTAQPVWAWSADCPPVRLMSTEPPPCGEAMDRSVTVSAPPKQTVAGLELRWGTEAMLREIPDALLPAVVVDEQGAAKFRAPKGATVFVRAAGPKLASGWVVVSEKTRIAAVPAAAVSIVLTAEPRERAWVEIRTSDAPQPRGLRFRGTGRGRVTVPPIPASSYVKLVAWSETKAPSVLSIRADAVPRSIELRTGQELRGAVADDADKPVAAAAVETLFAIPREELTVRKTTRSAADGTFRVRGVPAGEVELTITKEPFATNKQITRVTEDTDLGWTMLDRRRAVTFVVLDQARNPIREAAIAAPAGVEASTDAKGTATLKGVGASSFDVTVSGRGYLSRTVSVAADAEQPVAVLLERAAHVRAKLVDGNGGLPVQGGTVAIELDGKTHIEDFEGDQIELTDLTGGMLALEIRAHGLSPFRLPERKIAAGETVDLGTIQLQQGITITGRVIDAETRAALAGVSVRVLRPSAFGALLAWFRRDVVSGESAADGSFRISGLAPGTYALWTEGAGRAPTIKTGVVLSDEVPNAELDLGELPVEEGRRVIVTCIPAARCGTEAVLTLPDAEWFEISSPMADGHGQIAPVPTGAATLRLAQNGGVIHQRDITIGEDATTEVRIRLEGALIAGRVMRGGRPVSGGTVMFIPPGNGTKFVHVAQKRPAGVISNEILGFVPNRLVAMVEPDGRFQLADAPPGEYSVTWNKGGAPSAPRKVFVPEGVTEMPMTIEIGSASLAGTVLRTDGTPVADAAVQATTASGAALAITGPDGAFSYTALDPGRATVRANSRDHGVAEATVELREGEVTEVELKVRPENRREARVRVLSGGRPVANAFAFVAANGRLSAATTSADGTAMVRLPEGAGSVLIAAYGSGGWAFARPQVVGESEIAVEIMTGGASLSVHSERHFPLFIAAPTGFPIHDALALLGSRPTVRPSVPYILPGVPPGSYTVSAGGVARSVILGNEPEDVRF